MSSFLGVEQRGRNTHLTFPHGDVNACGFERGPKNHCLTSCEVHNLQRLKYDVLIYSRY